MVEDIDLTGALPQLAQLDDALRCHICYDIFVGPVILACGHSCKGLFCNLLEMHVFQLLNLYVSLQSALDASERMLISSRNKATSQSAPSAGLHARPLTFVSTYPCEKQHWVTALYCP